MALEKIEAVETKAPYTVVFVVDGRRRRADLTGLIAKSKHFRRFAEDKQAFRKVRVTEFGSGIEWDNGPDLSVETLSTMAAEQAPMLGREFAQWLTQVKVNDEEAARIFDVSKRTIQSYKVSLKALPRTFAITVRRCEVEPNVFLALYRPVHVAFPGRPKSVAKGGKRAH